MSHIIPSRERARFLAFFLVAALTIFSTLAHQAGVAYAEDPSTADTGSSTSSSGSGGTGGDSTGQGGDGAGAGGSGAATGGGNEASNGTEANAGGSSATGGTASADGAGSATSSNTATGGSNVPPPPTGTDPNIPEGTPTNAGPGSTTASNNTTSSSTEGASGSTGSQTSSTNSTENTGSTGNTSSTGSLGGDIAAAAIAGSSVASGAATAIGNLSQTEIVQIVIAIVNITMPGVNPADIVTPLVNISQHADVTNAGMATAITGGNSAVSSLITTVATGANVSAQQLAGLTASSSASTESGDATAVGNLSWTEVMQLASVIVGINGDTSLTDQLTNIQQSASVTNAGVATADTGGNTASATVSVQSGTGNGTGGAGGSSGSASTSISVGSSDDSSSDDSGDANRSVLLWGPAPAPNAIVYIFVDGRECKTAKIEEARDFPGTYDWVAKISPGECHAKNGSKMTFLVGMAMEEVVTFDNSKRESPQITFQAFINQTDLAAKGARR